MTELLVKKELSIVLKNISENLKDDVYGNAITHELIEEAIIRGLKIGIKREAERLEDEDV